MPHPHYSEFVDQSAITSYSFCLSTAESDVDSNSQADCDIDKSPPQTKPKLSAKPDPTIYSFAWSTTQSSSEPQAATDCTSAEKSLSSMATSGGSFVPPEARAARTSKKNVDLRMEAPTLPRPKFVSSLTHRDVFADYINNEDLMPNQDVHPNVATGAAPPQPQQTQIEEPTCKPYSNIGNIVLANTDNEKITKNCPLSWVTEHLFGDNQLPVPFNPALLFGDTGLWRRRPIASKGAPTFASLPDLSSESATMQWINNLADSLGHLHGLRDKIPSRTSQATNHRGDRTFNCEGATRPLTKGLITRKPDIVVLDCTFRPDVPNTTRLSWPVVQALIEISTAGSKGCTDLVRTLMDKASNMFDSQLHRRYVLGLAIYGSKGRIPKFIFVLIDRIGAACTTPTNIAGASAAALARMIFCLAFGNDMVLGIDTRVTFDRLTGNPISVTVDNQEFIVITEVYVSPLVFGRGTRVYIVRDQYGCFHILKDSWILSSNKSSEVQFIKRISTTVQTEALPQRSQVLCPRFVAGEEHIHDTDEARAILTVCSPARIHRRIVTGPIGDPITSYRSRVECLQAVLDVVDRTYYDIS